MPSEKVAKKTVRKKIQGPTLRQKPDRVRASEVARNARASEVVAPTPEPGLLPFIARRLRKRNRVDQYRLVKRLGSGYSAEVWFCEVAEEVPGVPLRKGQQVAVKFYNLPNSNSMDSLRIQREFSIAIEADHENLARVYDVVISPSRPNHTFMAMEYIPGPTLKEYVAKREMLDVKSCVHIARQLFLALEELHSLDAIHRDVKAANILCANKNPGDLPDIKLVDLGIVSVEAEAGVTQLSDFLGSKHSAPMEQLAGEHLDARADIYGVGAVMYFCLTGRELYASVGPVGAIVKHMMKSPETLQPSGLRRERTPRNHQFGDFVNSCISVDREDRPGSAEECLKLLQRF